MTNDQERAAFLDWHNDRRSSIKNAWAAWQARAVKQGHPTHDQIAQYLEAKGAWVTNEATRKAAIDEAAPAQPAAQDAKRLDWLDADAGECVLHLGKSWYTRPSYGLPYRKRASLREAIDVAIAAQQGERS